MDSIFTRIIKGEIPCYKVAEDEKYFAFLDINPLTKGHTLVIPKQQTDYLFDLDNETLTGLMIFAKRIAATIKDNVDCSRVAVMVLGLEVPHAHVHLVPIKTESDIDLKKERIKLTPEEFTELSERISSKMMM